MEIHSCCPLSWPCRTPFHLQDYVSKGLGHFHSIRMRFYSFHWFIECDKMYQKHLWSHDNCEWWPLYLFKATLQCIRIRLNCLRKSSHYGFIENEPKFFSKIFFSFRFSTMEWPSWNLHTYYYVSSFFPILHSLYLSFSLCQPSAKCSTFSTWTIPNTGQAHKQNGSRSCDE